MFFDILTVFFTNFSKVFQNEFMRIESAKKVFGAVFRNLFFFRRFLSFFNQFSVSNLSFFTIRPHVKVVV